MITKWSENSIELSIEKIGSFGSSRLSVVFCVWLSTPPSGTDGKRWPRSTLGSLPAKGDSSLPEYRFRKGRNKPVPTRTSCGPNSPFSCQSTRHVLGRGLRYLLELKNFRRPVSRAYNRFHASPNLGCREGSQTTT